MYRGEHGNLRLWSSCKTVCFSKSISQWTMKQESPASKPERLKRRELQFISQDEYRLSSSGEGPLLEAGAVGVA